MPRIRTIKPEFWTDEKIVELSSWARLLYIGMWNFADDNGVLECKPKQIKMRIFPADEIDILPLLDELEKLSLISRYSVNGENYLICPNLAKHQVIDKPRKSLLPLPENNEINGNQLKSTEIMLGREGKGKGNIKENNKKKKTNSKYSEDFLKFWKAIIHRPQDRIADAYNHWLKQNDIPPIDQLLVIVEKYNESKANTEPDKILATYNWIKNQLYLPPPDPPPKKTYAPNPQCPHCHGLGVITKPKEGRLVSGRCECINEQIQRDLSQGVNQERTDSERRTNSPGVYTA